MGSVIISETLKIKPTHSYVHLTFLLGEIKETAIPAYFE